MSIRTQGASTCEFLLRPTASAAVTTLVRDPCWPVYSQNVTSQVVAWGAVTTLVRDPSWPTTIYVVTFNRNRSFTAKCNAAKLENHQIIINISTETQKNSCKLEHKLNSDLFKWCMEEDIEMNKTKLYDHFTFFIYDLRFSHENK
jgi:hypothetical protein